jgi:hypothetical protein
MASRPPGAGKAVAIELFQAITSLPDLQWHEIEAAATLAGVTPPEICKSRRAIENMGFKFHPRDSRRPTHVAPMDCQLSAPAESSEEAEETEDEADSEEPAGPLGVIEDSSIEIDVACSKSSSQRRKFERMVICEVDPRRADLHSISEAIVAHPDNEDAANELLEFLVATKKVSGVVL